MPPSLYSFVVLFLLAWFGISMAVVPLTLQFTLQASAPRHSGTYLHSSLHWLALSFSSPHHMLSKLPRNSFAVTESIGDVYETGGIDNRHSFLYFRLFFLSFFLFFQINDSDWGAKKVGEIPLFQLGTWNEVSSQQTEKETSELPLMLTTFTLCLSTSWVNKQTRAVAIKDQPTLLVTIDFRLLLSYF